MILRRLARRLADTSRSIRQSRWQHARARKVHQRQGAEAEAAYGQLVSQGRPPLTPALSARIREYCADVLGSEAFQPWMRVYAVYQQRFVEGWIPDDYFELKVLPALQARYSPLQRRRTLSRRLFQTELFPDLAYCINGQWFTPEYAYIESSKLEEYVFSNGDEAYVKAESSLEGKGVTRIRRDAFAAALEALPSEDVVIQRPVTQHPWCASIYPGAVATLRITTSFTAGPVPRFRASYLRTGHAGRSLVQSDKQVRCSVIDTDGALATEALDERWCPWRAHPDTGFVYEGARVPHFAEAVATCLSLHARLPHDRIIGWDVAITSTTRPAIIEWNNRHPDIKFSEATVGPNFADCRFETLR